MTDKLNGGPARWSLTLIDAAQLAAIWRDG
jgi:hypothetical protein